MSKQPNDIIDNLGKQIMMNFESNKIPRQPLKSKRMQTFISKTEATMSHESEATVSSD